MDTKREIAYISKTHKGVFRVAGSSGHYDRSDSKNVEKWVEENLIGTTREGRSLIYDGTVLCSIQEGMTKIIPPCPFANQEFTYDMQLSVHVSPRGKPLPEGLLKAIIADEYEQAEER